MCHRSEACLKRTGSILSATLIIVIILLTSIVILCRFGSYEVELTPLHNNTVLRSCPHTSNLNCPQQLVTYSYTGLLGAIHHCQRLETQEAKLIAFIPFWNPDPNACPSEYDPDASTDLFGNQVFLFCLSQVATTLVLLTPNLVNWYIKSLITAYQTEYGLPYYETNDNI